MDVKTFASELLSALAKIEWIEQVALQSEGPVVEARAYVSGGMFVQFYFNEVTGTVAFALIREQERVWGIDRDNLGGWHMHPVEQPKEHVGIEPLSIAQVVELLADALEAIMAEGRNFG